MDDVGFVLNGRQVKVSARPGAPLLYVLRNDLGLKGARFGCGEGDCGSCMVWLDGAPANSCQLPLTSAEGHEVTTIEGLSAGGDLHPVQAAILKLNAGQCGYCLSGIVMTAAALIRDEPDADRARIAEALDGHLCRCGSQQRILDAVEDAARAAARP
jgi:aerobic-type carbon monoxide dehydrogenase small subunit (CoxS/CutS family)